MESNTLPPIREAKTSAVLSGAERMRLDGTLHYTVRGMKHTLPVIAGGPQDGEVEPPTLDNWPSHPAGDGTSHLHLGSPTKASLFTGKRYRLPPTPSYLTPGRMRKPAVLQQLEQQLERELQVLGCAHRGNDMEDIFLELQCYGGAFERLIGEFHAYRPLLSAIKAAYENTIQMLYTRVNDLLPLKVSLKATEEECARKILDCQQGEKQELQDMHKLNGNLQNSILALREEKKDVEAQVQKLSQELATVFKGYHDEKEARKLLISELNALKHHQQDAGSVKQDGKEEDPVLLQMRVKGLNDELKATREREIQLMSDYSDVVPRKDHEKLLAQHKELTEKVETMTVEHKKIQQNHVALQRVFDETTGQRDNLAAECREVKRCFTPRPDWDQCSEVLVSEEVEWSDVRSLRTSGQMMTALLAKVKGEPLPDVAQGKYGPEMIECMGTGKTVPEHLRFTGSVRNRHLRQKELLALVHELWVGYSEERSKNLAKKKTNSVTLSSFFLSLLEKRYALPILISEWAYSVHNACQRYSGDDAHIGLFHTVLDGQIDDSIYFSQLEKFQEFSTLLTEKAKESENALPMEQFMEALQGFFTVKSSAALELLCEAALEQANKGTEEEPLIEVAKLFAEDETGYNSEFIFLLRQQERQEKVEYLSEVENALQSTSSETNLGQLRKALQTVDPEKSESDLEIALGYAFAVQPDKLPEDTTVLQTQQIFERLQTKAIQRSGPPPATT